jgi:hypothetical protein
MANHGPTPPQQFGGKPAQPKTPKNTGVAQGQIQNWEDLSHILPEGGVQQGFQLRHETGEEPGSGSVHLTGPGGKWLARVAYTGKGTDNPQWVFHVGDQMERQPRVHTPVVNHLARALGHVFQPRGQFQGLLNEARDSESWNRDLDGAESMLNKAEKKKGGTWAGRSILDSEDAKGLETEAALREFRDRRPRAEAEEDAHRQYRHGHHQKAAAHHLRGMKMAQASGQTEEAHKHSVMYALHLQQLGHDPYKEPPPEVRALLSKEPDQKQYRYKDHGGDGFLLEKGEELSPGLVLKKAWPKDEQENSANAASHQVMEDAILEQGGQKKALRPHNVQQQVQKRYYRTTRPPVGEDDYGATEDAILDRTHAALDWNQRRNPPGDRIPNHEVVDNGPHPAGMHQVEANKGRPDTLAGGEMSFWQRMNRAVGLKDSPVGPKIKKAWPANEAENQGNAAAGAVAQDSLLDQGAKHEELSPGQVKNSVTSAYEQVANGPEENQDRRWAAHRANQERPPMDPQAHIAQFRSYSYGPEDLKASTSCDVHDRQGHYACASGHDGRNITKVYVGYDNETGEEYSLCPGCLERDPFSWSPHDPAPEPARRQSRGLFGGWGSGPHETVPNHNFPEDRAEEMSFWHNIARAAGLRKAWPRDEAENQANAASGAVAEDSMLDQGAKREVLGDPKVLGQRVTAEVQDRISPSFWIPKDHGLQPPPPEDRSRALGMRLQAQQQAFDANNPDNVDGEVGQGGEAPSGSGGPGHPNMGVKEDRRAEKKFWGAIGKAVGLKKGWPKNDAENDANRAGFVRESPPTEDKLMEQGLSTKAVHTSSTNNHWENGPANPAAKIAHDSLLYYPGVAEDGIETSYRVRGAHAANVRADRIPRGVPAEVRNGVRQTSQHDNRHPQDEDGYPWDPRRMGVEDRSQGTKNDRFWHMVGSISDAMAGQKKLPKMGIPTPVKKQEDGTGKIAAPNFKAPAPAPQLGSGLTNTRISDTVIKPKPLPEGVPAPPSLKITPQKAGPGGLVPPPAPAGAPAPAQPHRLDLGPGMAGHPRQISAPAIKPVAPLGTWKSEIGGLWRKLVKAWPKDEKENQANAQGFASPSAHLTPRSAAVAMDSLQQTFPGNVNVEELDSEQVAPRVDHYLNSYEHTDLPLEQQQGISDAANANAEQDEARAEANPAEQLQTGEPWVGEPASPYERGGVPFRPHPGDEIANGHEAGLHRDDTFADKAFWHRIGRAVGLKKAWPQKIAPKDKGGTHPMHDPAAAATHAVLQDSIQERGDVREVKPKSMHQRVAQEFRNEGHVGGYDVGTAGGDLPLDRAPTAAEAREVGDWGDTFDGPPSDSLVDDRMEDYAANAPPGGFYRARWTCGGMTALTMRADPEPHARGRIGFRGSSAQVWSTTPRAHGMRSASTGSGPTSATRSRRSGPGSP